MSDSGWTHVTFRLMIACAIRRYGLLLRTLPPDICRPYLTAADIAVRSAVFRILGVSHDVHTLNRSTESIKLKLKLFTTCTVCAGLR
jgi:hypothetical protein